ncbi:MAG: DNA polymerase III subunit alpha [Ardenticatenales bacterium]|nr:DNA polymerase III subunit alpha [Ardenticatenales bacterium]
MPSFTHLHVHSDYSLLDGLARIPDLVKTAAERNFDALALTDHGVMFGAVQFVQYARKAGIKPIIGCELYVANRTRSDRDSQIDRKPYHLTALAENEVGYRNLLSLVSRAQLEGFYYKPRVDRELLSAHAEGVIVFSGCPAAEVARWLMEGQYDKAREAAAWYADTFPGRYYIELQVHDIHFIPQLNKDLLRLADDLGLPTVATNDVHYCRETDVRAHEVLLCVQTQTTMNDPKRMKIGDTFYLRTAEEMAHLFREMPQALTTTAEIAERCNVTLDFDGYKLPQFDVPAGHTPASYLRALCDAGVAERYDVVTDAVRERLDYELSVIGQMGFDSYFLIVWDLCRFAAAEGVWWNVRGSGAGSIVSYALRITNLDPLHHQLIFERFLNPSRISMPDIDLDFPDDQRDLLIQYTFRKYGHDRVAQIITFGTMGARAAIRDAGRALDFPLSDVDRVARLVPAIPGKACGIADAMRPGTGEEPNEFYTADLVQIYKAEPDVKILLDTAQTLEGVARHASTHAAGVVICDRPLVEVVPLHRPTRGSDDAAAVADLLAVTQYNMKDVETLGLLKVDFLGLSTLTVLRRAAELVERYHGVRYTLDNIPLDDPAIYQLLSAGNVTGVFQVEGAGMRKMLREMRPNRFEHVVAAIALYRPGPMEYIPTYIKRLHGEEPVRYRHPLLEPILSETYGIIVYQEQIIQIARDLAGYDAGEADTIRKAVGKKIKAELVKHRTTFVEGAAANGIARPVAEGIFDDIETFARYGFNKAHAADYAVIVCQTAFLKAHHPVEYATALLSVDRDDTAKIAVVAADSRRQGIALLPPSVDASDLDFVIEGLDVEATDDAVGTRRSIRFGLAAIKNVGEGQSRAIMAARADGPFDDLDDLCRRVDLRQVGKRSLESLMKVGAFDRYGTRAALLATIDRMMSTSTAHHQAKDVGQLSLFGGMVDAAQPAMVTPLPDLPRDVKTELTWEKELIGLYLSDHPLHRHAAALVETITVLSGDIDETKAGLPVTMAGLVTSVRTLVTKKGATMAFIKIEDLQGDVELTLFPRTYEATRDLWKADRVVLVQGKVEYRGDRPQILVDTAWSYDPDGTGDADVGTTGVDAAPAAAVWRVPAAANIAAPLVNGTFDMAWTAPRPTPANGAPTNTPPMVGARHAVPIARPPEANAPADPSPALPRWVTETEKVIAEAERGMLGRAQALTPRPPPPRLGEGEDQGAVEEAHVASIVDSVSNGSTPSPPQPTRPDGPTYHVEVRIPPGPDQATTIGLLSEVFNLLIGFSGPDRFSVILPNGHELVELEFPNNTTRYCVDLLRKLSTMVGDERRIKVAAR